MPNGDIQAQVSDQYLQKFNRSIGVSGMQKLQSFPTLQVLGYNGQLGSMKKDFHGLVDFYTQMAAYSSVSTMLTAAWAVIVGLVLGNANLDSLLFTSPSLGTVGSAFQSIHGFAQVFALSPGDLQSPTTIASKVSSFV